MANDYAYGTVGDALAPEDYAPTSSVDLSNLNKSWGVEYDSDAIGPSSDSGFDVLKSSSKAAIQKVDYDYSPASTKASTDDAAMVGVGKIAGVITTAIGKTAVFRTNDVGKTIGEIGDAATPVAAAINPIAGVVVNALFTVGGAIGNIIGDEEKMRTAASLPPTPGVKWGSDIGITPAQNMVFASPAAEPEPNRKTSQVGLFGSLGLRSN